MNIIQFSRLGTFGRFGNQIFQYLFAKILSEKYNATLEIPADWIGRKIFENINDPPISRKLPRTKEDDIPNYTNCDLYGYYQSNECFNLLSKSLIKNKLKIKKSWLDAFIKPKDYYIACHIRHGDYISKHKDIFCIIYEDSYIQLINKLNFNIDDIIWVREESPHKCEIFEENGIGFLYDFLILLYSDILIRSNSTFSYWAGIFGEHKEIFSPIILDKVGYNYVDFSPNNWEPIYDKKFHKKLIGIYDDMFIKD